MSPVYNLPKMSFVRKFAMSFFLVSLLILQFYLNLIIFRTIYTIFSFPKQSSNEKYPIYFVWEKSRSFDFLSIPYSHFQEWKKDKKLFTNISAYHPLFRTIETAEGQKKQISLALVSSNYFDLFNTNTICGKSFPNSYRHDSIPHVIISYRLWRNFFHKDPSCIGQRISLLNQKVKIIGVLSPRFWNPLLHLRAQNDLWMPIEQYHGQIPLKNLYVMVRPKSPIAESDLKRILDHTSQIKKMEREVVIDTIFGHENYLLSEFRFPIVCLSVFTILFITFIGIRIQKKIFWETGANPSLPKFISHRIICSFLLLFILLFSSVYLSTSSLQYLGKFITPLAPWFMSLYPYSHPLLFFLILCLLHEILLFIPTIPKTEFFPKNKTALAEKIRARYPGRKCPVSVGISKTGETI